MATKTISVGDDVRACPCAFDASTDFYGTVQNIEDGWAVVEHGSNTTRIPIGQLLKVERGPNGRRSHSLNDRLKIAFPIRPISAEIAAQAEKSLERLR